MKELARQDRNGTRTSEELRRRYRFNEIELAKDELEYLRKLIVVDSSLSTTSINPVQNSVITQALNNKVNVEIGKGLSSNDFTSTLLKKLNGIATNAQVNIIESVSINGVPQSIENKNVDLQVELKLVDSALSTSSINAVENRVVTKALNNKVDIEAGKGLSANDFTDDLKNKLESIKMATEYSYYIVTTENITTIPITYSEYSEESIVDIYINGLKKIKDLHYSIEGNDIILTDEIDVVGTEIEVVIKNI